MARKNAVARSLCHIANGEAPHIEIPGEASDRQARLREGKLGFHFYPDNIDGAFYPGNIAGAAANGQLQESESVEQTKTYTAFSGPRRVASGDVEAMLRGAKAFLEANPDEPLLIFEDQTGIQTEFDFRGSLAEVLAQIEPEPCDPASADEESLARTGQRGRPKLGVVSREVSLLPRHWQWLERQPQGASAALRRLVELAAKSGQGRELARRARDAAGKFMGAVAGNLPQFEEALRALYAGDQARLEQQVAAWPHDIREHVLTLTREAARLDALARQ